MGLTFEYPCIQFTIGFLAALNSSTVCLEIKCWDFTHCECPSVCGVLYAQLKYTIHFDLSNIPANCLWEGDALVTCKHFIDADSETRIFLHCWWYSDHFMLAL